MPIDIETQLVKLFAALQPAADVFELNGPAGFMFAAEIVARYGDKPVGLLTLDEITAAYEASGERYNRMYNRE